MAYKIIKRKVVKPKEFAVHFCCSCGCEFWADQNSLDMVLYCGNIDHYETICPDCVHVTTSHEYAIPRDKVFTD